MTERRFLLERLHQVALPCRDLERAKEFYRDTLGAEYVAEFDPPGLVFFRFGETRLLLERSNEDEVRGSVLYFAVPDIQECCSLLKARGVQFVSDPHLIYRDDDGTFGQSGDEEWMAFFQDPDGHVLALASRTPVRREAAGAC